VIYCYHNNKKRAILHNQVRTHAATAAVIYCYHNNKKRANLHNQLRPVSLKDLINWLIGFWCNQEVIRGSGLHMLHWRMLVLTRHMQQRLQWARKHVPFLRPLIHTLRWSTTQFVLCSLNTVTLFHFLIVSLCLRNVHIQRLANMSMAISAGCSLCSFYGSFRLGRDN
jgi:hypothetical protein